MRMRKLQSRVICTLVFAALSMPAVAGAESLEEAKALSGVRFAETSGVPNLTAGAVDASKAGEKSAAGFSFTAEKAKRSTTQVYPPTLLPLEQEHGLAASIGAAAGMVGTVMLAASNPIGFFLPMVVIGAAWAGFMALATGARGRTLFNKTVQGAIGGVFAIANIGSLVGAALAHLGKKVMRKE